MVSIILDWRASSSKTRRSSEIERLSTSSETNVSGQTVCNSSSLGMASPARWERHTNTSITFGSKRVDVPFWEMALRLGWISHGPSRKSLFTTYNYMRDLASHPFKLSCASPKLHHNIA